MSQQAGLARRNIAEASEGSEQPARPKVMRRPTNFSTRRTGYAKPQIPLTAPHDDHSPDLSAPAALPVPHIPARTFWQDDLRFGAVMLLVVIATNAILMLWLPHMRPTPNHVTGTLTASESPAAIVQPEQSTAPVTLYTKPTDDSGEADDAAPVVHTLGDDKP